MEAVIFYIGLAAAAGIVGVLVLLIMCLLSKEVRETLKDEWRNGRL